MDCFSVGMVIADLLRRFPIFCSCPEGPSYLRERLAVLCHLTGPINSATGMQIEREHPGTFVDGDFTLPALTDGLSTCTFRFLQTAVPLDVSDCLFVILQKLINTCLVPQSRPP